jgi:FKBP-type peptidyl-prolyl cis-trans isomerase SlyD
MKIAENKVVEMHYQLTDENGTVLDSSKGREPLSYIQGIGNIIVGLEKQMEGKVAGDKLNVVVEPTEGYGERDEKLVQIVPKSGFQGDEELAAGMQVQVGTQDGQTIATVAKIDGEDVTLDVNHPLAGVTLTFDVEVVNVREATKEELEHGHVHGPDGHQH